MKFAKRVFLVAGIYGVIVLAPQYFLLRRIGADTPPPITHPEYFYGFVGVALSWQLVFFAISRDPIRFRPLMPVAVVEKASFGIAAVVLFALGRLSPQMLAAGLVDIVLGTLFVIAWVRTRGAPATG